MINAHAHTFFARSLRLNDVGISLLTAVTWLAGPVKVL